MAGTGRIFLRGQTYWIAYYHRGKEYRESAKTESERKAQQFLRRRTGEIDTTGVAPRIEERVRFTQLEALIENDYIAQGNRTLSTVKNHLGHLKGHFGLDRVIDITPPRVSEYQVARLEEGASRATVNREVATLNRMMSLAVKKNVLIRKAHFELLDNERTREGFLYPGDFAAVLGRLPTWLQGPVEFLYLSGWRVGEMRSLRWTDVSMGERLILLKIANSKTKKSRLLTLEGRVWTIVQDAHKARRLDCPFVFHHNGRPIGSFRKRWNSACKAAGIEGIVIHDLRRSATRNLREAGVQEKVAMDFTGHVTREMFDRYNITDSSQMRAAQNKLDEYLEKQAGERKVRAIR